MIRNSKIEFVKNFLFVYYYIDRYLMQVRVIQDSFVTVAKRHD